MYATAATHLPHPIEVVVAHATGGHADPSTWLPELRRTDAGRLDAVGTRLELDLCLAGASEVVPLTVRDVVRSTITASGATRDGRAVDLRLSFSPWDGGTAAVLSLDVDGASRPVLSWAVTRRLEAGLVRLAGELAGARSPVGPARP